VRRGWRLRRSFAIKEIATFLRPDCDAGAGTAVQEKIPGWLERPPTDARSASIRRRRRLKLVAALVVIAVAALGFYFVVIYVPSFPIPAGTLIHLEDNQSAEWFFRVTRCCATIGGSYHADHPVGWWRGTWSLGAHNLEACAAQSPGGPVDGNFSWVTSYGPLNSGSYLLGVTCGSQPSVTITITATVQLVYT